MRKIGNIFIVIGMGLLLIGGYNFPTIVTAMEDKHLKSDEKRFEIEAIELRNSQIDFFQELYRFSALMEEDAYIQKRQEEPQDGRIYQQVQKIVMEFLDLLEIEMSHNFEEMQVYSFVLTDFEAEQLYPIWYCNATNENEESCTFWIDEITGKILSFQISASSVVLQKDTFEDVLDTIVTYYGFEQHDFEQHNFDGYYETSKGWDGTLLVVNNETKEYMKFPFCRIANMISFNIYGEIAVKNVSSYE